MQRRMKQRNPRFFRKGDKAEHDKVITVLNSLKLFFLEAWKNLFSILKVHKRGNFFGSDFEFFTIL
jgi:hypothetical protein